MFDPVLGPSGFRDRESRDSSLRRLTPSSVAPYVWPEDHIIPIRRDSHLVADSRHRQAQYRISISPSIPPPQRPVIPYAPAPRAAIKLQIPSSSLPLHGQQRTRQPLHALHGEVTHHVLLAEIMPRSPSHSSQHSDISVRSGDIFRTPSAGSGAEGRDDRSQRTGPSPEPDPGGSSAHQRPKRSRVLMTHTQQQRLNLLWKRVSSAAFGRGLGVLKIILDQISGHAGEGRDRRRYRSHPSSSPSLVSGMFAVSTIGVVNETETIDGTESTSKFPQAPAFQ